MNNNKSTINQNTDKKSQSLQSTKQVAGQTKTLQNANVANANKSASTTQKGSTASVDSWKQGSSVKQDQGMDLAKNAQSNKKLEGQQKEDEDFYRGEVIKPYAESEGKEMPRKSEMARPYTDASEKIKREESLQPHVDVDDSEIPGSEYLNGKKTDIDKRFAGASKTSMESSKRRSQSLDNSGVKGASKGSESSKKNASEANSESSRGQGFSHEDREISRRQDFDKRGTQSSEQQKAEKDSNFSKRKV